MNGLFRFVLSIYNAWFMVLMAISGIARMFPNNLSFVIVLHIITLVLFVPIIYQYHILKTIDEFGEKLDGSSK